MPTTLPSSTTGRWRIRRSVINDISWSTPSPHEHVTTSVDITEPTDDTDDDAGPGLNRAVWDLRWEGAEPVPGEEPVVGHLVETDLLGVRREARRLGEARHLRPGDLRCRPTGRSL